MPVRALFASTRVLSASAPYDALAVRVFYPALAEIGPRERETGVLAPDPARAPFPVVVFLPGVNCPDHTYHWLAASLAARGLAVLTYSWIAENLPGRISLTPGLDRAQLTPQTYGQAPSCTALPGLLETLARLNASSILAGHLDLSRLIFGGHSAGGMMALMNADPRWFPAVTAAFSYCASPYPTLGLGGFPPGALAALPSATPVLMLGATEDGIGDQHNRALGLAEQSGADTIAATFDHALTGARGDSHLIILRGANHHTVCHPRDDTVGRTFLDRPATEDEGRLRGLLAALIGGFVEHSLRGQAHLWAPANPLITVWRTR